MISLPLWQTSTFVCPLLPSLGVAKATVTVAITVTVIITITLRIETLWLTRIIPPYADGAALSLWIVPLDVRVFFPSLLSLLGCHHLLSPFSPTRKPAYLLSVR